MRKLSEKTLETIIDYSDKFDDLFSEVYPIIKDIDVEFTTIEDYDNCEDYIYELPRFMAVAKYGYIKEYVIYKISGGVVYGLGLAEESGEAKNVEVVHLNYSEIIGIINYIK